MDRDIAIILVSVVLFVAFCVGSFFYFPDKYAFTNHGDTDWGYEYYNNNFPVKVDIVDMSDCDDDITLCYETYDENLVAINYGKAYRFVPKKDITAYELALCMPILIYNTVSPDVESLPLEAQRHWELVE